MAPNLPQIRVSDIDLLNDWDLSNVKAFSDSIPGYRSGATFLTTLRSNLHLSATYPSPYSSLVSTPTTPAFSTALLTHPNPSVLSISSPIEDTICQPHIVPFTEPEPEPDPILTSTTVTPTDTTSRTIALALIASSITEQRAANIKAVARHQVTIAFLVLLTATLYKYATPFTTLSTLLILSLAGLGTIHYITHPYASLASSITSSWLTPPPTSPGKSKSEDPLILVSKYGDAIVGALVLRVVKRERKAYVRAWTVDKEYRGRGIGSSLLEQGVRVAWGRGARGVGFEEGIIHCHKVLPNAFNAVFEEREGRARRLLGETVAEVRRERSSR